MSVKTKAFLYQVLSFAVLFIAARFLVARFTELEGIWISLTAFAVGTLLAPQFKAVTTQQGDRLFMTWIFMKGVKELK